MTTATQEIRNMRLISHHDLNGFGNIGEGMHLHRTNDGRRILYLAHESAPKDITSVDVTDIANPKVMVQTELAYPHLRSNSLSIVDDVMLVAYQSLNPGQPGGGMGVYDISNVEEPRRIGFLDTSGPYSRGCHCLWWVEGNYAHLSTGAADFQPRDQKDDQFYMIVDVPTPPTRWKRAGGGSPASGKATTLRPWPGIPNSTRATGCTTPTSTQIGPTGPIAPTWTRAWSSSTFPTSPTRP